jgi:cell division protein FtsW
LFIGRARTKHLLLTIGVILVPVLFLIIAAVISHRSNDETAEVKKEAGSKLTARVDTWISRVEHFIYGGKSADDDDAYQVNQAKIAIAKGAFSVWGPVIVRNAIFCPRHIMILSTRSSLKNMD